MVRFAFAYSRTQRRCSSYHAAESAVACNSDAIEVSLLFSASTVCIHVCNLYVCTLYLHVHTCVYIYIHVIMYTCVYIYTYKNNKFVCIYAYQRVDLLAIY